MSKNIPVTPGKVGFRIKKIGLIDFSKLYSESKAFFDNYKYIFNEVQHKGKDAEKGKKLDIKWNAFREVDDYAKFEIKVNILIFRINEVKGLFSCEIYVYIEGNVVLDYKNKMEIDRFRSFLFNTYNKYIIRRDIEREYIVTLNTEVNELRSIFKALLEEYD